eukprot:5024351-Pleurochrysis_carterae.AAC.1
MATESAISITTLMLPKTYNREWPIEASALSRCASRCQAWGERACERAMARRESHIVITKIVRTSRARAPTTYAGQLPNMRIHAYSDDQLWIDTSLVGCYHEGCE